MAAKQTKKTAKKPVKKTVSQASKKKTTTSTTKKNTKATQKKPQPKVQKSVPEKLSDVYTASGVRLTVKEAKFIDEYIQTGNLRQSVLNAGYQ